MNELHNKKLESPCAKRVQWLLAGSWWNPLHGKRPVSTNPDVSGTSPGAVRYAVRFFALMLVLTLVARGTSGAAMPRVKLQTPSAGVILRQTEVTATLSPQQGQDFPLPPEVTADYLAVSVGQSLKKGDTILRLNREELKDALTATKIQLAQKQAQYANLSQEDTLLSAQRSVDHAKTSLEQAGSAYEQAKQDTERLAQSNGAEADALALQIQDTETQISGRTVVEVLF
ncbi:MAG: hypothetical protein H9882_06585 [Candidatus Fournierella pullistercoris]|uniref:Biotin/lipoyl-binding protein n=1 Tax=Candidatus Allofournierella pullistercoris TaxID=2838597 RepID=A0A948T352_9FIRM|nr:hypothetical protein [Candidatus Fournierella pullistercoris]